MDLSGEVANIHMRTDAKNLVTTARTIHLPEQKETIHLISILRKEACSGSTHDLAHIPTQNCLADCLTKASAKADNLTTPVQTRRLLDVDVHPDLRTLMEHKASLSTRCQNIFAHKGEGSLLPEHSQDLSCTNSPRRTISGNVCGDSQPQKEQKKPNTRKRKGQDTTKITSAPAESCLQFPWSMMTISMTTLTWMVRNIPDRTTIKEFTVEIDEAGFVRQYNFFHLLMRMLCLCLDLMNLFAWC